MTHRAHENVATGREEDCVCATLVATLKMFINLRLPGTPIIFSDIRESFGANFSKFLLLVFPFLRLLLKLPSTVGLVLTTRVDSRRRQWTQLLMNSFRATNSLLPHKRNRKENCNKKRCAEAGYEVTTMKFYKLSLTQQRSFILCFQHSLFVFFFAFSLLLTSIRKHTEACVRLSRINVAARVLAGHLMNPTTQSEL